MTATTATVAALGLGLAMGLAGGIAWHRARRDRRIVAHQTELRLTREALERHRPDPFRPWERRD